MSTLPQCFSVALLSLLTFDVYGYQQASTDHSTTDRRTVATTIPLAGPQDRVSGQALNELKNKVRIAFIEETGSVRIVGNEEDVLIVQLAIQQFIELSRHSKPEPTLIPLVNAHSQTTARQILEIYQQQFLAREGPVSITPIDFPSGLLVVGRPGAVQVVRKLAELFDIERIQ